MSRYRLEIRPSVEKTLRKIRDERLEKCFEPRALVMAENKNGASDHYREGGINFVYRH
jgi:hypothetical protein